MQAGTLLTEPQPTHLPRQKLQRPGPYPSGSPFIIVRAPFHAHKHPVHTFIALGEFARHLPDPPVGSEGRRGRWGTPTMALHLRILHPE